MPCIRILPGHFGGPIGRKRKLRSGARMLPKHGSTSEVVTAVTFRELSRSWKRMSRQWTDFARAVAPLSCCFVWQATEEPEFALPWPFPQPVRYPSKAIRAITHTHNTAVSLNVSENLRLDAPGMTGLEAADRHPWRASIPQSHMTVLWDLLYTASFSTG